MAGMDSIVASSSGRDKSAREDEEEEGPGRDLTGALAALWYLCSTRLDKLEGKDIDAPERYKGLVGPILDAVAQARASIKLPGVTDEGDAWAGWRPLDRPALQAAILRVDAGGYTQSDWYREIRHLAAPEGDGQGDADGGDADGDVAMLDDGDAARPVQGTRADSMLRDDYFGEGSGSRRGEDFESWRTRMLTRIGELEARAAQPAKA